MPQKPLSKPGKKIEKKQQAANRHGKMPLTKKGERARGRPGWLAGAS
jgi:hypothetical protein